MPTVEPNTIPQKYKRFGLTKGFHPRPFESLRWLIKAQGGWGKSTFLSSIPNCLHLDIEGGAHSVVNSQADRVPDEGGLSWEDLCGPEGLLNALLQDGKDSRGDPSKLPWRVLAFDTIDAMFNLFAANFCNRNNPAGKDLESVGEYGKDGAGYGLVYARLVKVLTSLESYGYALVLACHEKERQVTQKVKNEERTITVVRPVLGESIAKLLEARADISAVLRPKFREIEEPGRKVQLPDGKTTILPGKKKTVQSIVMQVECSPAYQAKRRLLTFRGEIHLPIQNGWEAVKAVYDEAAAKLKEKLDAGGPLQEV